VSEEDQARNWGEGEGEKRLEDVLAPGSTFFKWKDGKRNLKFMQRRTN